MRFPTFGVLGAVTLSLWLCSCASTSDSDRPHATVVMRDGTRVSGSVTSSSPSEITLAGDDKAAHTIAMKDVRRVDYDEPVAKAEAPGAAGSRAAADTDAIHDDHYHPAQAAIATKTYQLGVGTQISVRNEETIDSAKTAEGQVYAAEVTHDVLDASGAVVIPRGSNAQIEYRLSTTDLSKKGRDGVGKNKRTAAYTGGGAAIGAIIGAIAGGGKGAAIGAGAGAGAGALTQVVTKGQIRVPAETVMTFQLDRPLSVVAAR